MDINKAKNSVLKAGIQLVESGLVARTWGNVSCRVDEENFVITPSGRSYQSLTAADLVRVKIKDLSYQGEIKPSSEKGVHAGVYKLYPDINFVIHTHQDNASVIAATGLKKIEVGGEYPTLGGEVICAEYALPGTKALCKKVQKALGKSNGKAVIMKHHGALCFGGNAEETFTVASELEKACAEFVVNHYLKLSKEAKYDPSSMYAFAIGQNSKTKLPILDQEMKTYGWSRRSNQGFIWYDGERELEIPDNQSLAGLPEETRVYRTIYNQNKQINQIIFKATPEILELSAVGINLKPLLNDFAQIIGLQVRTVDKNNPDMIAQALSKSTAVLILNTGALCCGLTKDDAVAVGMILQKSCKALIGASLFGKTKPINPVESMIMRYVYLKKYSKQTEKNILPH
mgnify:FL=1